MAADNELQIILSLVDKASADIKKIMADTKKSVSDATEETKKMGKESKKATNDIQDGFREAHKGVREFHQIIGTVGFAVAAVTITTKAWAESNIQTRRALDEIGITTKQIIGLLGSLFAPLIISLGDIMKSVFGFMKDLVFGLQTEFTALFSSISFGVQRMVAFTAALKTGVGVMEAWKISGQVARQSVDAMTTSMKKGFEENIPSMEAAKAKLKEINDIVDNSKTRFIAGEASASEYYQVLTSEANQALSANQMLSQQIQTIASLKTIQENPNISALQNEADSMQQIIALQKDLILARDETQQNLRNNTMEQSSLIKFALDEHRIATQGMAALTVSLGKTIQTNLSSALTGIITGAKTAKDAFSDLGKAMIEAIVNFIAQKLVAFAIEKTLLAGTVAATTVAALALTDAWTGPAFLATVATLGLAAAQAPASLAAAGAATVGVVAALNASVKAATAATGGGGGSFAGGIVNVPDDMFAQIHKNEMIVPADFADEIRKGNLNLGGGGQPITIQIYGNVGSGDDVRLLAEQIGFEIERQGRFARGI